MSQSRAMRQTSTLPVPGWRHLRSSAIRDLLAITERPEIISMAGGLPAPELFPNRLLAAAMAAELSAPDALQYSTTQGHPPLREWIGARAGVDASTVIVTHGSQQALDLVARALVEPGRPVVLGDPGYIGAIQAFGAAGGCLTGVASDGDGLRVDLLAEKLAGGLRPAVVYVVPNFDNPTGASLGDDRRLELARLAEAYGFWIVSDDPYAELRWEGRPGSPLEDMSDRVISLGSFSKILCPGLRVGWAVAPEPVLDVLVLLKQAADLHTATLAQRAILRVVATPGFLTAHLTIVRGHYQRHADALGAALCAHLGDGIEMTRPHGGLFIWARLPGTDTSALLPRALAHGVAFVPGAAFEVTDHHRSSLRLSFATVNAADLDEGCRRLALAIRSEGTTPVRRATAADCAP